jgi:hypothetical protein
MLKKVLLNCQFYCPALLSNPIIKKEKKKSQFAYEENILKTKLWL